MHTVKRSYLIIILLSASLFTHAQSKKETEIAATVEAFRKAVINADSLVLEKLLANQLSFGHSSGKVETKKEFIHNFSSGAYDFVTMDFSAQTISVADNIAIVRNKLDGQTADNGKPGEAHLLVLMIWQKRKKGWQLLARQAVKLTPPTN